MIVKATCERCGYTAYTTSECHAHYVLDWDKYSVRPWDRRVQWPFKCHQRWMEFELVEAGVGQRQSQGT